MAHPDLFHLSANDRQAQAAAEHLFERVKEELQTVLPATAEVLHVGATAVPGCLTKGDLDIVVRVEHRAFQAVEDLLATRFPRNPGSTRTDEFASFEDECCTPHLGIQLTTKGGAFDMFHLFAAALCADPALVHRYNALKLAHDGQSMDSYRAAKDAFVADVLLERQPIPTPD
jgi:GrpB-like predicted nucleotidyltransferase (UPF0157 family)